jgi:glycerol-3-phosphate O-acyltransferase
MGQATRFQHVERLSHMLMDEIADVLPVVPVALMSEILLEHESEWRSELELKTRAAERLEELEQLGAPINLAAGAREGVFSGALTMLEGRGLVDSSEGLLRATSKGVDLLKYYANSIRHWQRGQGREVTD